MPEMEHVPFFFPDFSLIPPAVLDDHVRRLMAEPLVCPYQDFGDYWPLPYEQSSALYQAKKNYGALEYALAQLGVARLRAGDLDAAEGVLRTIVLMGSWHAGVFDYLFTTYLKRNDVNGALWVLGKAAERVNYPGMDYHYAKAKFFKLMERGTQYEWDAQGRAKKIKRPRRTPRAEVEERADPTGTTIGGADRGARRGAGQDSRVPQGQGL